VKTPEPAYQEPPEEDNKVAVDRTYAFNPLQAKKEIATGDFYMKRGNYGGAAMRYREATLWDDGSDEAFFKWGEASEKAKNYLDARDAFGKFLAINTDKKKAADVEKRLQKYPKVVADPVKKDGAKSVEQALEEQRKRDDSLRSKGIYTK
jgi:tetratricopeptide (TPR) repeat protein